MRKLTMIIPFYRNSRMPQEHHIPQWSEYPDAVLERLSIILVDDCSPERAQPIIEQLCSRRVKKRLSLYRILEDIPWNQHGARNLGAHVAKDGWLLFTDMDRIVLTHDMRRILEPREALQALWRPYGASPEERWKTARQPVPGNAGHLLEGGGWV